MSKIEWTDITWNPVWGCNTGCPYCYARKIARRFGDNIAKKEIEKQAYCAHSEPFKFVDSYIKLRDDLKDFKPTFIFTNYIKKFPKKPKRIFVNSMSDVWWWKPSWMERVLERIKQYPQHTFMFLTKFPEVYWKICWPKNCWLGLTITNKKDIKKLEDFYWLDIENKLFISFEPLLEEINPKYIDKNTISWVIIGAETGHRPEKVVPDKKWIRDIEDYCIKNNIPLFEKDNLASIILDVSDCDYLIQQFPEDR